MGSQTVATKRCTRARSLVRWERARPVLVAGGALLCTAVSVAQAQSAPKEATALEEVVVTGTRLGRSDLEAASPVISVAGDAIRLRGPTTVDTVVNELPQLAPTDGRQAGFENRDAVLKADLRGLDPVRTLVLVNGRRFTPASADGLVDLGTIPTAMVERIDVLTGGASSVYGSDAIAGAINFVLKNDFEGVQVRASYGETFENDGQSTDVEVLAGTSFGDDRGHVMVAARYFDGDGVLQGDREFSRVPYDHTNDGELIQVGSSAVPGGFIPGGGFAGLPAASCPSGSSPAGVLFLEGGAATNYCNPADAYNYAPDIHLLRPFEQAQLSGVFQYELNDQVSAFGELFFVNATTDWQVGPDGKVLRNVVVNDYLNNPIVPASTRDFLIANAGTFDPLGTGNATISQLRKRFTDVGSRKYEIDRNSYSLTGGLRGNFGGSDGGWKWEAFGTLQNSTSNKSNSGVTLLSRLAAGLDTTVVGGQVRCTDLDIFPDCTPFHLFGEGSLTDQQAAWLAPTFVDQTDFSRDVAGATLTGSLLELPAGPLATAFGVEYRKDSFRANPSPASVSGDSGISSGPPVSGDYDVKEAFVEAGIPLIEDRLDLELGARLSDYSLSGVGTAVSYKAGTSFKAAEWLRVRAAYNRAVRAPNLLELYAPTSVRFLTVTDPCDSRLSPSQAVKDLCVDQGIPAAAIDTFTQLEQGAFIRLGGNRALEEESSDSITVGAVLTFPDVGVNVQIDYYAIKVEDAIGVVGQQTIVDNCFTGLDANDIFCTQIERDNIGQLYSVSATQLNLAEREVSGLDVTVDYGLDAPWLNVMRDSSTLKFSLLASFQFENKTTPYRGAETIDCAGRFLGPCSGFGNASTPETRLLAGVDWANGPLNAGLRVRWIDELSLYPGVTFGLDTVDAVTYVDLNVGFEVTDRIRVDFGVQNVFDELPQPVSAFRVNDSNSDPALYDQVGARYFLGVTAKM